MKDSLFVSDVHLCESRPHIAQAFEHFLNTTATHAQALYILGDLFEYWAGDDAIAVGKHRSTIQALKRLTDKSVAVYLMHGNRDFLIGNGFTQATGVKLISDPSQITLFGKSTLLSHGDALCTDDIEYQKFRLEVRQDAWKSTFLSQPIDKRIQLITQLREKSELEKSTKSMLIMDVNQTAVENLLAKYAFPPIFIHGHTHRPNKHILNISGNTCERWVLGDWYEQGSYIQLDSEGCHAHML